MKKYSIIVAITAACLALRAAVLPHTETVEETPAPLQESMVSDPAPTVEDTTGKAKPPMLPEEEMIELPQAEPLSEVAPEPEHEPTEITAASEAQPTPKPVPEQKRESTPMPIPSSAPSQVVADPQPGDMVYVPGFGWLECQGPGEVIYAEDMYENGNKVGVMG